MQITDKIKNRCISTMKSLIGKGVSVEKVVSAVSDLTEVPKKQLEKWLNSENFYRGTENAFKLSKKEDKLTPYRDKSFDNLHPDDARLREIQEEYLINHSDF